MRDYGAPSRGTESRLCRQTVPSRNQAAAVTFTGGNGEAHGTAANGDWGGMTAEGPAVFTENNIPLYIGRLTIRGDGGNDAKTQSESGFTVNFTSGGSAGYLAVHGNFHGTANAAGAPTSSVANINVTCS